MYSRAREKTFNDYPLPEMLRTRLEEVILQIKMLQLGRVKEFLANVMDPPDLKIIDLSLDLLRSLNALDEDENLTPLGYHLAHLPLNPRTGNFVHLPSPPRSFKLKSTNNSTNYRYISFRKNDSLGVIVLLR